MKELPTKEGKVDEKTDECRSSEDKINNISKNMEDMKLKGDSEVSRTEDVEESCDKILNNLSDKVSKLNIEPGEGDESQECDEDGDKTTDKFITRGPYGGQPVQIEQNSFPNTANKRLPMALMNMDGSYMANQQMPQQSYNIVTKANGRRSREDSEDSNPPTKFINPGNFQQPSYQHNQMNMGLNNLTSGSMGGRVNQQMASSMFDGQNQRNVFSNADQKFVFTGNNSGGTVTVTSPTYSGPNPLQQTPADALLDSVLSQSLHLQTGQTNMFSQMPMIKTELGMGRQDCHPCPPQTLEYTTQAQFQQQQQHLTNNIDRQRTALGNPNFSDITLQSPFSSSSNYTGPSFTDRRQSDFSDSGVESAEEKSPYSDPAPSPTGSTGSAYTSPPSVDSGFGVSPMHETNFPIENKSQIMYGMSPPKYPGVASPNTCRATPSPSSGYGSPQSQILDDNSSYLGPEREEEFLDAMKVINEDIFKMDNKQKKQGSQKMQHQQNAIIPPQSFPLGMQRPVDIMHQNNIMSQQVAQNMMSTNASMNGQIQGRRAPAPCLTTMPQTNIPVPTSIQVNTTTNQPPQQIIILPPQQQTSQPLIMIPVNPQLIQAPKIKQAPKQPRKILPKISSSLSSSTSNMSSSTTSVGQSKTSMTSKVSPAQGNKGGQQQANAQAQQNKLLMIARRTVADIPRDDLKKADDEEDTYLHIAVCKTDRYMVQALLERLHREGLDNLVDQENNKRQTPLYLAVFINQPVMVAMFIRVQANVNVLAQNLTSDDMTTEVKAAIHVAASQGSDYLHTMCQLLKAKDISINIVNNYGQTALHCAILSHGKVKRNSQDRINSIEMIKALIKAGADPSAQDKKSGKTPLMYAIEQRNLELVEAILTSVDPNKVKNVVRTQAFDGSSCLKLAEGLKDGYNVQIWNKLWNSLQSAANGTMVRMQQQHPY